MIRSNIWWRKLSYNKLHRTTKTAGLLCDAIFWSEQDIFRIRIAADKKEWENKATYPSKSISGRGCPESELIPPINPFGGTRPPFFFEIVKQISVHVAFKESFRTHLWASKKLEKEKLPPDILAVHPILMERLRVEMELSPLVRLIERKI